MNNDAVAAIQTSLTKQTVVYVRRLGIWGPLGTARSNPKTQELVDKARANRYVTGIMVITKTSHRTVTI